MLEVRLGQGTCSLLPVALVGGWFGGRKLLVPARELSARLDATQLAGALDTYRLQAQIRALLLAKSHVCCVRIPLKML